MPKTMTRVPPRRVEQSFDRSRFLRSAVRRRPLATNQRRVGPAWALPAENQQPHSPHAQQRQRRRLRHDGEYQVIALYGQVRRIAIDRAAGAVPQHAAGERRLHLVLV